MALSTNVIRMTESDLRIILAHAGCTWETDVEIDLLGADTIIRALHGDGCLVNDAGWDANIVDEILSIAADMGFEVIGHADK